MLLKRGKPESWACLGANRAWAHIDGGDAGGAASTDAGAAVTVSFSAEAPLASVERETENEEHTQEAPNKEPAGTDLECEEAAARKRNTRKQMTKKVEEADAKIEEEGGHDAELMCAMLSGLLLAPTSFCLSSSC